MEPDRGRLFFRGVRWLLALGCLFLALSCLAAACLAVYNSFTYFSWRHGVVLAGFLALGALFLWPAWRLWTLRDPVREKKLAFHTLAICLAGMVFVGLAEGMLSLALPALTYHKAQHLSPEFYRKSRILPFELRPGFHRTIYEWESDRKLDYTINHLGFRGPEFSPEKKPGTYRILLLGDSFAINNAIPDVRLHTHLLEEKLNRRAGKKTFQVINCGYADAYSPDAYIAFMLQRGFALDPDLVIMQYFIRNDFKDLLETEVVESKDGLPFRVQSRERYIDGTGRLRRRGWPKYKIPVLREMNLYIHLYDLLHVDKVVSLLTPILLPGYAGYNFQPNSFGIRYRHVYAPASERPPILQAAFEQSMDYVRRLARESEKRGIDFVLFVVPTGVQMSDAIWRRDFGEPPPANWENPFPQSQIADALRDDGIDVFDPLAFFREQARGQTLYLGEGKDGHWTAAGCRVAAEALDRQLAARLGLGPPPPDMAGESGPPPAGGDRPPPPTENRHPSAPGEARPHEQGGEKPDPYALVLGTAQDGGLPQVGAEEEADRAAWRDPGRRRLVASLLIADPRTGRRWLIDATPDLREQVERSRRHPPGRITSPGRPPLFDGIFLTHAHMGHYAGLLELGREAYAARGQPVYGSERMVRFLQQNEPWSQLVSGGYVVLRTLQADREVRLGPGLSVVPFLVPHRAETTDTFGFLVRGPSHSLLYIPDTDAWERWDRSIEEHVQAVDTAFLDGTFFGSGEVQGRDMSLIPHPFIEQSLGRFASLPEGERRKIFFIHLNHTNPGADPGSAARRRILAAGLGVAAEGQRAPL